MKIFEIENHNVLYTFNLNRVDRVILGDGSVPVERAKSIFIWQGDRNVLFTFESPKEARKNYDMIKELIQSAKG